jgi:excisionase family DNA binding protein
MQVTIPEAARLLRISEHTVRRRLRNGELPGVQVANAGGFVWMVEMPDELQVDSPSSGEVAAMKALIARMEAQIEAQEAELEARRREVRELHVLLQQAQAALPAPREGRSWWRRFWYKN